MEIFIEKEEETLKTNKLIDRNDGFLSDINANQLDDIILKLMERLRGANYL